MRDRQDGVQQTRHEVAGRVQARAGRATHGGHEAPHNEADDDGGGGVILLAPSQGQAAQGASAAADTESSDEDELLPAAVDVVLETGQASVSMLQRRLKLGYSRAARLVDQMEERGIVGPFEGSKPRQLLITRAQWDEMQMGGAPAVEDAPPFDTGDE